MPRIRPCRSCGKPCQLGGKSSRPDPMCIECFRAQAGRDPRGRPRIPRPGPAPCPVCGETYQPRYRKPGRGGNWTEACSQECGWRLAAQRRASEPPSRNCDLCGQEFSTRDRRQRYCGKRCRDEQQRLDRTVAWPARRIWHVTCAECGRLFIGRRSGLEACGDAECRRKHNLRKIKRRYREDPEFRDRVISKAHNRHARKLGIGNITSPAALINYLMQRDHGRCGICRKPIRAKAGPRRPSIDHIIPLSRGGEHALENLQAAHYDCNLSKGNRGGGQVLLVG